MPVTLTPQQKAAVENRGGSLLVSAAAGSGKTRVLVDRLFRYITEERRNIDDFLIITYTRAAAAELRGKIAAELSRRMGEDPANAHLRRQLLRVYQADIKTVDAFCAALLRENTHLLAREEDSPCRYCDWAPACHFQDGRGRDRLNYILPVKPEEFWREIEGKEAD